MSGVGTAEAMASYGAGDSEAFRALARKWAASVTVVTVLRRSGGYDGFTATAFLTVSLDPPIVLVSATLLTSAAEMLADADHFVVNLLAHDQRALADSFATPHEVRGEPFLTHGWDVDEAGVPRLRGAMGAFSARVRQRTDAGDHVLVLGDVTAVHHGTSESPLVYHNRGYGTVDRDNP